MRYYMGLDGGSTYLKAALIGGGQVVDTMVHSTGIDNDIACIREDAALRMFLSE